MNKEKVIIYTGSFNPITKGHTLTMKKAIEAVNADKGLFYITPKQYLSYKMYNKVKSTFILSPEVRTQMIESLSSEYEKMYFGGTEVGCNNPSTVKTINRFKRSNKTSEVYLLMGADKLRKFPRWDEIDSIIDSIKVIVAVRKGFDIKEVIENDQWLTKHKDKFIIIYPEEAFEISSTEVRKRFMENESYKELMDEGPYNIFKNFIPNDFPQLTNEAILEYDLKCGGMYAYKNIGNKVYAFNKEMFDNWDTTRLGDKEELLKNTKTYKTEFKTSYSYNYKTQTDCVNQDCIDVAEEMIMEGLNPAILNLASKVSPCGGYHKGTNAQEECLAQASTLSQSLYQFGSLEFDHIKEANLPNIQGVYPIDINYGGIYSKNVVFFRYNKSKYYALREKPFACSIITVPSLSNRKKKNRFNDELIYFNNNGTLTNEGKIIQANKIRTIFRIALENNHDSLVLGAFGCGVFNLLPTEVSKLFFDVLNEPEFKNNFKKIVFAILENKKNYSYELSKFKPFYDLFKKQ